MGFVKKIESNAQGDPAATLNTVFGVTDSKCLIRNRTTCSNFMNDSRLDSRYDYITIENFETCTLLVCTRNNVSSHPRRYLGIISRNPSVSKSIWLHIDIFQFFYISLSIF